MSLCNLGIKIEDAISFVAMVRYKSISHAASALGLPQPSVSRRIQSLEDALGVVLLDRNTRPPKPTAIGLRVFDKCLDIVNEAQALRAIVDVAGAPFGSLRIGMTQRLAELSLGQALQYLAEHYQDLSIQATTCWSVELLEMVRYNELHCAILQAPASTRFPEEVSALALMPMDIVVVAPKGRFPKINVSLADCSPGPWILNPEGCNFRRSLIGALLDQGLPFKVAMDGFGTELQMLLISQGLGLGLLPLHCVESSSFRNLVDILQVKDFHISTTLWLVHNANVGNLMPAIEACGKVVSQALSAILASVNTDKALPALQPPDC
jgi:DNA-binding transcriptional LysR family regulator